MNRQEFKNKVLEEAKNMMQERVDNFEKQISRLQNAQVPTQDESVDLVYKSQNEANHEVSNLIAKSMKDAVNNLTRLEQIEPQADFSEIVEPGAVVMTNQGTFFVSVSTHNFEVDGKDVMGVSTKSPIYLKMIDMKKGDSFQLRDLNYVIEDVF